MKALTYIVSLLLSLPNLIAGLALLVLQYTFATRNPIAIAFDFLFAVVWGLPAAAIGFIALLVLGLFSVTRPYAALLLLLLNLGALALVLLRIGPPTDVWEGVLFLPVLMAQIGCAWIAYGLIAALPNE